MTSCYGCRHLIQSSDGECGCLKYPSPYNQWDAHSLGEDPRPLYEDCYASEAVEGAADAADGGVAG